MNPIIDGIIALEGGYVFNPKDKGGATHWGITEATARAHGYAGDMRDLTHAEAYAILEEDYWIKPGFDVISTLSWPVSFELCDAAVNIGAYHPSAWLQRWLNVFNHEGNATRIFMWMAILARGRLPLSNIIWPGEARKGKPFW